MSKELYNKLLEELLNQDEFKLKEDVNFPIELKTDFSFEEHINEQLREAEIKIFEYLSEENTRLYKDLRELNNKTFEIHEKIIDTIKKVL